MAEYTNPQQLEPEEIGGYRWNGDAPPIAITEENYRQAVAKGDPGVMSVEEYNKNFGGGGGESTAPGPNPQIRGDPVQRAQGEMSVGDPNLHNTGSAYPQEPAASASDDGGGSSSWSSSRRGWTNYGSGGGYSRGGSSGGGFVPNPYGPDDAMREAGMHAGAMGTALRNWMGAPQPMMPGYHGEEEEGTRTPAFVPGGAGVNPYGQPTPATPPSSEGRYPPWPGAYQTRQAMTGGGDKSRGINPPRGGPYQVGQRRPPAVQPPAPGFARPVVNRSRGRGRPRGRR